MLDSVANTPSIGLKVENLRLIQINFDHSDNSTRESNPSGEVSKCDNITEMKNKYKKSLKQKNKKSNVINKNDTILNKKTKRGKNCTNNKKIKDIKNNKYKIILNIFNEFKTSSPLYKEFPQFHAIEKNVKKELYSSSNELAGEIRNVFSHIFSFFFNDSDKYNKTLLLCELFEKIYKKYDNKLLTKECKNLVEMINKLKRELRQTEIEIMKNTSVENNNFSNNNNAKSPYFASRNKFKFQFNDSDSEIPVKKYKNEISNKIKSLNNEQKKGLFNVLSNDCIDKNTQNNNNVMEINVNKMTFNQLKQLEKYVNQCIKDNISRISTPLEKTNELSRNKFFEDEKDSDILKNDDLSSCLSDDDEDEDDE
jgi:hypothetical protein